MVLSPVDRQYMGRALQLARRGCYTTRPNPCVGCLLVDAVGQNVIAEAWHHRAGEPHAEINALQIAGDQARDKTLYVTLEPCSHHGRTGPCVKAIIAAGIKRVVYAMEDPNPRVGGAGLAMLRAAGIQVDGPLLGLQAQTLNRGFVRRMETERPFVCCKLAMSIDGRTAMANGQSQWITGSNARSDVQRLRARSCAVITGIGSILQDNSRLTVRSHDLIQNIAPPLRVVVDSQLRTPIDAAIFADKGTVIIATSEKSATSKAAEILARQWGRQLVIESIAVDPVGQIDLDALLHRLATTYHCNQVLIEAGATLSGAFLQQDLLDEIILYMAPILMGSDARPLFNLPLLSMHEARSLVITDQRAVGRDWRITVCPRH
jgi:diaminohydroxyphosphoribosylaminopyrimidine deaminase / 5-amino-6-(5-phosphoribosylamino)uracil reductase